MCHQFNTTCQETFHLTAHGWQAVVGVKTLQSIALKKSLKCPCVRPTVGGKSLIFNVVTAILKGVTICICPLLSLGADQTKKILVSADVLPLSLSGYHFLS